MGRLQQSICNEDISPSAEQSLWFEVLRSHLSDAAGYATLSPVNQLAETLSSRYDAYRFLNGGRRTFTQSIFANCGIDADVGQLVIQRMVDRGWNTAHPLAPKVHGVDHLVTVDGRWRYASLKISALKDGDSIYEALTRIGVSIEPYNSRRPKRSKVA